MVLGDFDSAQDAKYTYKDKFRLFCPVFYGMRFLPVLIFLIQKSKILILLKISNITGVNIVLPAVGKGWEIIWGQEKIISCAGNH